MRSPIWAKGDLSSSRRSGLRGLAGNTVNVSGVEETPARDRKSDTLRIDQPHNLRMFNHSGYRTVGQPECRARRRNVRKHRKQLADRPAAVSFLVTVSSNRISPTRQPARELLATRLVATRGRPLCRG